MSITDIANAALVELGADRITAIDDNSQNAKACAACYPTVLDAVLRSHPWNSATTRAVLPAEGTAPLFGFGYQYPLPTDPWCLRVLDVNGGARFKIEGRKILTDEPGPIQVLYIRRIDNPDDMDGQLRHVVALRLGAAVAYRLSNLGDQAGRMMRLFEAALREARSSDAQEGTPDDIEADELLESRM